jgi:hypothetical protein
MLESSWVVAQLVDSQEGLSSMKLVSLLVNKEVIQILRCQVINTRTPAEAVFW